MPFLPAFRTEALSAKTRTGGGGGGGEPSKRTKTNLKKDNSDCAKKRPKNRNETMELPTVCKIDPKIDKEEIDLWPQEGWKARQTYLAASQEQTSLPQSIGANGKHMACLVT